MQIKQNKSEKSTNLIKRLTSLKIDQIRYQTEKEALIEKGYTDVQADTIIIRICSKNSVEKLLQYHDVLTSLEYGFNHEDLSKIAAKKGGGHNIEAVKINCNTLKMLGFTIKQIVMLARNTGGSHNLIAVRDNCGAFLTSGFTIKQIVTIAANVGGSKNLAIIKDNFTSIFDLGFTIEQIVMMVGHGGGSHNLIAVLDNGFVS